MMAGLSKELVFLILQFLDEESYKESVHRLESESGLFCNVKYVEDLVTNGNWEELEKYLAGFIHVNDNRYSVKMLFEIRKQKYLEALDRKDHAKALEILNNELKVFKTFNEDLFKEMTLLLTMGNFRENEQLSKYTDTKSARAVLLAELKKLVDTNPDLREKCLFPGFKNSRLRLLINQSLNWQHQLCKNPKPNPEIKTLFVDHACRQSNAAQAPSPVPNQLMGSVLRPMQPPEAPAFLATSHGQGIVNSSHPSSLPHHPISGGALVPAAPNAADSELTLKRSRPFGIPEQNNLPTSSVMRPGQSHAYGLSPDDLPKKVILTINHASDVKSMDFHPVYQTLLLVGANTGDIALWEVGSRLRIAHKSFNVWNIATCSMALQASLANEYPVSVNRVMWSPDGRLLGVAYSKHIVHLYAYRAGNELRDHLEIEAHVGNVSDLAFAIPNRKLCIITCGEDRSIKVWDAATGANQHTFEGHGAPVYSICPHHRGNIQFIFSTSIDGKIKAWLYDDFGARLDYDAPGYTCTRMAYSSDGLRLFSCGTSNDGGSYLVEWNESEGTVKRTYLGLGKQALGVVQFDASKRLLVAGDEGLIKFWDMDNKHLLSTTNAEGGLPASPCVRFSKDGIFLAVSTSDNGVKVLANAEGLRLVRSIQNQPEAPRTASGIVAKATTITASAASSSTAGAPAGFPDRTIPIAAMVALNQDSQNLANVRSRNTDELESTNLWKPKEITEPSQLRSLRLPDNLLAVRIVRLMYANSGSAILALAYNAVHKLWKWQKTEQNTTGNATTAVPPHLWQPSSGILMTNDIRDANLEDAVPCFALSKNNSYVMSASGGKVSLFNLATFKTMTTFMHPPPAATCLVFHPDDNNIIAIGMSDSSVQIYNVRVDEVMKKLTGHQKSVTGLAFCTDKNLLVSSGADAQLCVWKTDNWEMHGSKFLQIPARRPNNPVGGTRVQFNLDQTLFMVVHGTHIAIFDPLKLDCSMQWVPRPTSGSITDAVYSCDGQSIFVSTDDGSVSVLTSQHLRLKCRINPSAYLASNPSSLLVSPNAIAAHPSDPNQVALGLSDGGICVLEPLESEKQWGNDPSTETGVAGPSTNPVAAAASSVQP
ncbi:topless-related protein 4-like isoform X2 [Cynara cardunculus var. scolymus]|uniref:topless-related protein 4-like isoform X2 n=1 Tax=Cynara cardunculus var. scolymus TaxID=59895 RepID=UPI000D62E42F|nr:topless-related protein 4-like isoform X2 [Cynara cardunculus var. scolymus]